MGGGRPAEPPRHRRDDTRRCAKAPGAANAVTRDDDDANAAVSLRDALAFSPGVYLQPRCGQEVRVSIRESAIGRGNHFRGITLFQNGIPINLAHDSGDFQELNPQLFERIEGVRGANALAMGGASLGGAINGISPTGRSAAGLRAAL